MIWTPPTKRASRTLTCVAITLTLAASACGGDDPDPLTVADLNADTIAELEVRDAVLSRLGASELSDDTRLTAADVALYRTVATVYLSTELRRSLLLQSLDDWEATAASLRTRRTQPDDTSEETAARDRSIDEFKAELERILESPDADVDVDFFLQVPAVDRMIVVLEDDYASSGLAEVG